MGHLWVKWMGSYFFREMLKNTGLQGSTLFGPCMTIGFGPFELPTRGLLQKGRDHSPPKFYFVRSPAFWLVQLLLGAFRAINIQIAKQIGGGVDGQSYCIIN